MQTTVTTGAGMEISIVVSEFEQGEGEFTNSQALQTIAWIIDEEERLIGSAFPFTEITVSREQSMPNNTCGGFRARSSTAVIRVRCVSVYALAHEVAHAWFRGNDIHEAIADEIELQVGGWDAERPEYSQGLFGDLRRHYGDSEFNRRLTPLMNPNATMTDVRAAFGDDGGAATEIIDSSEVITTDEVRH